MESSSVLAFRIFVMLSCLIIVPMAAIFGSAFPDVVKAVLVDRIVAWTTGAPLETAATGPPSGFGAVTPEIELGQATGGPGPQWGQASSQPGSRVDGAALGQGVIAAAANAPEGDPSASYAAAVEPRGAPSVYAAGAAGSQPSAYADHPANGPAALDPRADLGRSTPQPLVAGERFTALEQKLREYGATYYLLETWGSAGESYRFHCKMAIGNNPNYTRHFEATDRDALRAMAQVLEKVELWREGRLQ